jgi:hypothetical protein
MTGVTGVGGGPWVVQAATGRSAGDHVCWPFRDRGELAAVARAFVAEGLGRDERVAYVGQGRPRELRHDLAGISNLQDCLDRGQLQVSDIAGMPASDPATDPVDELIDLAAMTRDSLDAGYTGLRIVAHGTLRVISPRRRDRIVHFEHLCQVPGLVEAGLSPADALPDGVVGVVERLVLSGWDEAEFAV